MRDRSNLDLSEITGLCLKQYFTILDIICRHCHYVLNICTCHCHVVYILV